MKKLDPLTALMALTTVFISVFIRIAATGYFLVALPAAILATISALVMLRIRFNTKGETP